MSVVSQALISPNDPTLPSPSRDRDAMEDHAKKRVGVLALQGAFQEHSAVLQRLGAQTHEVRTTADLDGLDGIVLPGAFGFLAIERIRSQFRTHPRVSP